jgi:hypothetical protein
LGREKILALLDALWSGAKAFIKEAGQIAAGVVRAVLEEIDRSEIGKAITSYIRGAGNRYFNTARDLAEEESELAAKRGRDGKLSESDRARWQDIQQQRTELRGKLQEAKTSEAAQDLKEGADEVQPVPMSDDDVSASTAVISSKVCPECGGTMGIRQGGYNTGTNRRSFWWQCTSTSGIPCPTIKFDPEKEGGVVVRRPDPDLDGKVEDRRKIWQRNDVSLRTHGRVRGELLGEEDEEIVCPHHLLPMKLIPKRNGKMLESYEYVCPGVMPDGSGCQYSVPLETYPQVSAALRRNTGRGIIDG